MISGEGIGGNTPEEVPEALPLTKEDWAKEEARMEDDYSKKIHAWGRSVKEQVEAGAFSPYITKTMGERVYQTYALQDALKSAREDLETSKEKLRIGKQIEALEALLAEKSKISNDEYNERKAMQAQMEEEGLGDRKKK